MISVERKSNGILLIISTKMISIMNNLVTYVSVKSWRFEFHNGSVVRNLVLGD